MTKGDSRQERRCSDHERCQISQDQTNGRATELAIATIISSQYHEEESSGLLLSLGNL
jgi:hypothetical protein